MYINGETRAEMECVDSCHGCQGAIQIRSLREARRWHIDAEVYRTLTDLEIYPAICGLLGIVGREQEATVCNTRIRAEQALRGLREVRKSDSNI